MLKLLQDSLPADVSMTMLAKAWTSQRDSLLCSLSTLSEETNEKARETKESLALTKEGDSGRCLSHSSLPSMTNTSAAKLAF